MLNNSNIPQSVKEVLRLAGNRHWIGTLPPQQMKEFRQWVKENRDRGDKWRGYAVDLPNVTVGLSRNGGSFQAFCNQRPKQLIPFEGEPVEGDEDTARSRYGLGSEYR